MTERLRSSGLCRQEIGKKEYLEDCEQDEQLDQDDGPQGFAYCHAPEPVEVEPEDLFDCCAAISVAIFTKIDKISEIKTMRPEKLHAHIFRPEITGF